MSDRFATSLEIGGKIPRSKLQELINIINSSDMSHDWGEPLLRMELENDLLCSIHPNRKTLILVDLERAWGDVSETEEALQELGLTYKVLVEAAYEYPAELKFWSPESKLIELSYDGNGKPMASYEDLKEILSYLEENDIYQASKGLKKFMQEYKVPALEIV